MDVLYIMGEKSHRTPERRLTDPETGRTSYVGGFLIDERYKLVKRIHDIVSSNFRQPTLENAFDYESALTLLPEADLAFLFQRRPVWSDLKQYQHLIDEASRYEVPMIGVKKRNNFPDGNAGLLGTIHMSGLRLETMLSEILGPIREAEKIKNKA